MFANPWIAALSALFLWWFFTGAILLAVRYSDNAGSARKMALLCSPLLPLGFAIAAGAGETTAGVYAAFIGVLAIWGWIELAFLCGVITGPNRNPCPDHLPEWERFIRAWGTIAYHEMLLVAALVALAFLAPGTFAFWTFAILFFARVSAKLNLFLGVPKINTEFLPSALLHLPSHFRHSRMNWLFPVSITLLCFATACWLERLYSAQTAADTVGFSLLAALTALAMAEHWLMVLPLPDEKLWRWMLPAPKHQDKLRQEQAHGF